MIGMEIRFYKMQVDSRKRTRQLKQQSFDLPVDKDTVERVFVNNVFFGL
jgi:hypothetical protein